jgi:hypothetical protein
MFPFIDVEVDEVTLVAQFACLDLDGVLVPAFAELRAPDRAHAHRQRARREILYIGCQRWRTASPLVRAKYQRSQRLPIMHDDFNMSSVSRAS